MTDERDPYVVLGVARTATTRQIRAAYVALARKAHPDIVGAGGLDAMRALNEAWELLKDPAKRAEIDGPASADPATAAAAPERDSSKPFWTGAMGPPPGRAFGTVLDFGIYAGWSLGEIGRRDRGYLYWLRDKPEARPFRAELLRMLDLEAREEEEQPAYRRRR